MKRNGRNRQAKGEAKVVDQITGAKIEITFFGPFSCDYQFIKLGSYYDYAVGDRYTSLRLSHTSKWAISCIVSWLSLPSQKVPM